MSKYYYIITLLIIVIVSFEINKTSAHPGNTDSSGGHTCRTNCTSWGLYTGQYHYHGGSYYDDTDEEEYAPNYYYQQPKTQIPEYLIKDVKANITPQLIDNGQGCGYNVDVEINTPGILGSIKTALTRSNKDIANKIGRSITYKDFTPGKWYLNAEIGSSVYDVPSYLYWDVNLPDVVPYSEVKLGENDMVTYNLKCIQAISSTNEILQRGIILSKNKSDGSSEGAFQSSDVYGRQEVVVTDYYGKQYTSVLDFPNTKALSADIQSVSENIEGNEGGFFWVMMLLGMGGIIFAIVAIRTKD